MLHSLNILNVLWFWFSYCSIVHCFQFFESDESVTESGEIQELYFGDLDIRVGRIFWVDVHNNDVSHFHMKANFNNSLLLTCVTSEIASLLKKNDFLNRLCIFIVNVKPLKVLGTLSEALLLTTLIDEWWLNPLDPPEGTVEGDIVYAEGYDRNPLSEIDSCKSNFRNLIARMRVNENGVVMYNNVSLNVNGKGPVTTENLNNIGLRDMF